MSQMEGNPTLDTYNASAEQFVDYFSGIGPRTRDIEIALELAGKLDGSADVLEIGCGDGRDAAEIIPRVASYTGIDYSQSFIDLAQRRLPDADLRVADATRFEYPSHSHDVVFAFASLLHLGMSDNIAVSRNVNRTLRDGGLFYVSLKAGDGYGNVWQEDAFGMRQFYYYSPDFFHRMCAPMFEVVYLDESKKGNTQWFEMGLRRQS